MLVDEEMKARERNALLALKRTVRTQLAKKIVFLGYRKSMCNAFYLDDMLWYWQNQEGSAVSPSMKV